MEGKNRIEISEQTLKEALEFYFKEKVFQSTHRIHVRSFMQAEYHDGQQTYRVEVEASKTGT